MPLDRLSVALSGCADSVLYKNHAGDLQDLQVAEEGEESFEGALQGNGEDVLQVNVENGGRNVRCFRSSILSSSGATWRRRFRRRIKKWVKRNRFTRTANERRRLAPQRQGRGTTEPSACDLRIAREEIRNNK